MPTAPKMAAIPPAPEPGSQPERSIHEHAAEPSHEEIAQRAYQYWEARGRPMGSAEEDWFRAEQDLMMERLVWGSPAAAGGETVRPGQKPSRKPRSS